MGRWLVLVVLFGALLAASRVLCVRHACFVLVPFLGFKKNET